MALWYYSHSADKVMLKDVGLYRHYGTIQKQKKYIEKASYVHDYWKLKD